MPLTDAACRRFPVRFLKLAFALAAILPLAAKPAAAGEERFLSLYNIHTKETVAVTYKRNGQYIPDAMQKINLVMRDWRKNEATKMDPPLIDLIWELHRELGSQKPVSVISGYRAAGTNERMRRRGGGQAKHSQHILGHAADISFPDVNVAQLRASALIRERGGVGFYPKSGIPFVHVDTGRVRHWPRMPRQELALLFPSGQSQHTPADGRPLTRDDFRIALAKLETRGGELPLAVRLKLKKPATPQPILASLGPNLNFGAPKREAPPQQPAVAALPVLPFQPASPPLPPQPASPPLATPRIAFAPPSTTPRTAPAASMLRNAASSEDEEIEAIEDAMYAAADEEEYHPFPLLPLMAEVPLARIDVSINATVLMSRVHMMFAEPRQIAASDTAPLRYAAVAETSGPRRAKLRQ